MKTVIAIDFETANYNSESACALSMVRVVCDEIVGEMSFLIKPPSKHFCFTYLHGIAWEHVRNAPTFASYHPKIHAFTRDADFFAAHNAPFDRGVLRACCEYWGLDMFELPFLCTLKAARRHLGLPKNSLDYVCSHLKIPLKHHDAASDARGAAKILLHLRSMGVDYSDYTMSRESENVMVK